jgi:hypothetical protein
MDNGFVAPDEGIATLKRASEEILIFTAVFEFRAERSVKLT